MNDEYKHIADELKEMIIEDYLAKHPTVRRSEIILKTFNGKVVVDTVTTAFQRMGSLQRQKQAPPDKQKGLLLKLAERNDVRYTSTLNSVSSCHRYVDWLFQGSFFDFGEKERDEHKAYLERKEQEAVQCLLESMKMRKKFTQVMESCAKKTSSVVKTMLVEYLQAVLKQCRVQADLYNREMDLSQILSEEVQAFLRQNFNQFVNLGESVLIEIGKACELLRSETYEPVVVGKQDGYNQVKESLDRYETRLQKMRMEISMTSNLINFLEEYIKELEKMDLDQPEPGDETNEKGTPPEAPGTTRRMVHFSRRDR